MVEQAGCRRGKGAQEAAASTEVVKNNTSLQFQTFNPLEPVHSFLKCTYGRKGADYKQPYLSEHTGENGESESARECQLPITNIATHFGPVISLCGM